MSQSPDNRLRDKLTRFLRCFWHTRIGIYFYRRRDFIRARHHFDRAVHANERACEPHIYLYRIFLYQRRLDLALDELRRARQLDPKRCDDQNLSCEPSRNIPLWSATPYSSSGSPADSSGSANRGDSSRPGERPLGVGSSSDAFEAEFETLLFPPQSEGSRSEGTPNADPGDDIADSPEGAPGPIRGTAPLDHDGLLAGDSDDAFERQDLPNPTSLPHSSLPWGDCQSASEYQRFRDRGPISHDERDAIDWSRAEEFLLD